MKYIVSYLALWLGFLAAGQLRAQEHFSQPSDTLDGAPPAAQWIWDAGSANPTNYFLLLRKNIVLDRRPNRVVACLSACAFADLYVNGEYVDRCPINSDPVYQVYEKRDLTKYFHAGTNTIAALAYNYGVGMHSRMNARGGFFFQGEIQVGPRVIPVNSDGSWLVRPADAWNRDAPFRSDAHLIGFVEQFDARKMPDKWQTVGFDDRGWSQAHAIGVPPVGPWKNIVVTTPPPMFRETVSPVKQWEAGGRVVYDFGRELAAWPVFEIYAKHGGTKLVFDTAERLTSNNVPLRARIDYTDSYVCKQGFQTWSPMTWRGLRYLSVPQTDEVVFKKISAINRHYDLPTRGSFECSDPLLNRIWKVGVESLRVSSQDTLMDCIWREQTQYIAGDSRMCQSYADYAFGPGSQALFEYNILSGAFSQRWYTDGSIRTRYPTDYLLGASSSACLLDYELEWVIMLGEHWRYFGDDDLLRFVYPNLKRVLQSFAPAVSQAHGLLANLKGWIVLDHPPTYPMDKQGEITAVNCLYYAALSTAADLAGGVAHQPEDAAAWRQQAATLKTNIQTWLWSPAQGLYADRFGGSQCSQQTQAYALLYGLVSASQREKVCDFVASQGRRSEQSFSYYLLNAMFGEREQWSLDYVRTNWGAQMRSPYFNGTWHECWDINRPDDIFTTCHPWCSGPTALLPQKVLGVEPMSHGWTKFSVRPHPCDLQWAQGVVPTKFGPIAIAWHKAAAGKFGLQLKIPAGSSAQVELPGTKAQVDGLPLDSQRLFSAGEYNFQSDCR